MARRVAGGDIDTGVMNTESKMTPTTRSRNHHDNYVRNLVSNHMLKHFMDKQRQEEMETLKFFKSDFITHLCEAVILRGEYSSRGCRG